MIIFEEKARGMEQRGAFRRNEANAELWNTPVFVYKNAPKKSINSNSLDILPIKVVCYKK